MKTALFTVLFAFALAAQTSTLPTLPPVNTVTAGGVTCTVSVIDAAMSIAYDCIQADGSVVSTGIATVTPYGALITGGPIACALTSDGAATPTVRLNCSSIEDAMPVRLLLDGKLAPVTKKRQWRPSWK